MSAVTFERVPAGVVPVDAEVVRRAARELVAAGFAVCRIHATEKRPVGEKWPVRGARPEQFQSGEGVGLVCGPVFCIGGVWYALVCAEGDTEQSLALGLDLLPRTGMIDFRPYSGKAHFWYLVECGSIPAEHASDCKSAHVHEQRAGHRGPKTRSFKGADGSEVVRLVGTGGQAVAPPSLHDSGFNREWRGGVRGEPARVKFPELFAAVMAYAQAQGHSPAQSRPAGTSKSGAAGGSGESKKSKRGPRFAAPAEWLAVYEEAARGAVTLEGVAHALGARLKRYRAYIDGVPHADRSRTGKGGSNKLLRDLRVGANDFLVRDPAELRRVAAEYNDTLPEPDQWSDAELDHKVDSALAGVHPDYPPGCKLPPKEGDEDFIPMDWDDPARLAAEFLAERPLKFIKSTPFAYEGGRYAPLEVGVLASQVRTFAENRAVLEFRRRSERHQSELGVLAARELRVAADHPERQEAAQKGIEKDRARLEKSAPKVAPKVAQPAVSGAAQSMAGRAAVPEGLAARAPRGVWLDGRDDPRICVGNGLLRVDDLDLIPHTPGFFCTAAVAASYDPSAACPKWVAAIDRLMRGDAERVAVLQEVFGACLDANLPAKFFALLVGESDCGKTTFTAGLLAVIGAANAAAVPLNDLAQDKFAGAGLLGKLANVVPDQGYFESKDEAALKGHTGGEQVRAQRKGVDGFEFFPTAKFVVGCNTAPNFADPSAGVWNRMVAVPFDCVIPKAEQDARMKTPAYWAAEARGMLNWALVGLRRLKANGDFTPSAQCSELKRRLLNQSNPLRVYLAACYRPAEGGKVHTQDILDGYKTWQHDNPGRKLEACGVAVANQIRGLSNGQGPWAGRGVRQSENAIRIGGKQQQGYLGLERIPDAERVTEGDGE